MKYVKITRKCWSRWPYDMKKNKLMEPGSLVQFLYKHKNGKGYIVKDNYQRSGFVTEFYVPKSCSTVVQDEEEEEAAIDKDISREEIDESLDELDGTSKRLSKLSDKVICEIRSLRDFLCKIYDMPRSTALLAAKEQVCKNIFERVENELYYEAVGMWKIKKPEQSNDNGD